MMVTTAYPKGGDPDTYDDLRDKVWDLVDANNKKQKTDEVLIADLRAIAHEYPRDIDILIDDRNILPKLIHTGGVNHGPSH